MNALTLPRTVASLQYKALRAPAALVQTRVLHRLSENSRLRLGVDSALAGLDEVAGRVLDDAALAEQGRLVRRRSELLEKASELDDVAAQRRQAAEAVAREGRKQAEQTRTAARDDQQAAVAQTRQEERAAKQRADRQARTKAEAEKKRVAQRAEAKVEQVTHQLEVQEARIDAVERRRTAAPKAQLADAVAHQQSADTERAKAERLGQLAATEKARRRATS